jgi:hypothetical protein
VLQVKSASAPQELKKLTMKMAHTEDIIEDLTVENSELKRALLKVIRKELIKPIVNVTSLKVSCGLDWNKYSRFLCLT